MILFSIIASVCLICIGMLNTNGLTLLVSSELWSDMVAKTSYYGAVLGTAHNFENPVLWMRLATMFGLGLLTAGVWATFDSHFLMRSNAQNVPANYRQWTTTLALLMSFVGVVILTCTEYVVKTEILVKVIDTPEAALSEALHPTPPLSTLENIIFENAAAQYALATAYPFFGWILLLACTVFVALLLAKRGSATLVGIATALQFLTLAGFAVIRQIGQNQGMAKFIDVSTQPEMVQWDTLIAFLVCFLLGVGVIVWMVVQCVKCAEKAEK